ncbi:plasmid mobilization protein [Cardinium endosymbiont of Dermatophagoides farinae]|uniref:plasmid mobilization protein n=1 Tax=Cardinium endosymbiont of Dermatophagoides farinae TaxID=2597823 RepID=UPI001182A05E|nr:hypothetical protein [Cardinium endosymbiont of Dermatophagoides farinae]TSJ79797.1 hypothetical protein FPG78_06660 [Cardinium endosymbiont of Dermatophagoides farinae]
MDILVLNPFWVSCFFNDFYVRHSGIFTYLLLAMRPKKVTHKSSTLSIRLYPTEKIAIKLLAKNCGLSLSDYLRKIGLNQTIKSRFTQKNYPSIKC